MHEEQAIERGRKIAIREQEVCFAASEDLMIHKVFAGRPGDLEDIRSVLLKNPRIEIISKAEINGAYLSPDLYPADSSALCNWPDKSGSYRLVVAHQKKTVCVACRFIGEFMTACKSGTKRLHKHPTNVLSLK